MLRNRQINALFFVGACVIALITMQAFWMRNALQLKSDQFDREVKTVLGKVSKDFDDQLYCHLMFTNVSVNPGEGLQLLQQKWDRNPENGSKHWNQADQPDTIPFYYKIKDSLVQAYPNFQVNSPTTVQILYRINVWLDSTKTFESQTGKEGDYTDLEDYKSSINRDLENAVNPILLIKEGALDSIVMGRLQEADITIPYSYAVYKSTDSSVLHSARLTDPGLVESSKLKINLLENNPFFDGYTFKIHFPTRSAFIIKGNALILLVSIAVVLALIISFFVYMRFLLKQVQLDTMKSNFVNNMTHEFKTPISNISLAIENIDLLNGSVDPRMKKYLRIINDENSRMITNVERILEVARYSNQEEAKISVQKIPIHILITDLIEAMQLTPNVDFKLHLNAEKDAMEGDDFHLRNIINNLIDNAIKYNSRENKIIEITTRNKGQNLEIAITDNGEGIESHELKRIFDPFYRRDTGNVHTVKGFGLGLSYVKRAVEMHGGTVTVESKPGQGSTFTIIFPRKQKSQHYESKPA